ncbi:MAG: ACT domain-containing protein [Verrucomicrobiae bacterium]|nr:ACT domain-containing protein [Verrucomicrobiae bacterium]
MVAVMSRDRVGIVRDVTRALGRWDANVEHASQTVVMNYFTLIMVVGFPESHTVAAVRDLLRTAGTPGELEVGVKLVEPTANQPVVSEIDRFILTAVGADRPGIVRELATFCAARGINITDLYGTTTADGQFIVISELAVPRRWELAQLQLDLAQLGQRIGVQVTLQHENIFRATNEVTAPGMFT